jgi:hypothetical protein
MRVLRLAPLNAIGAFVGLFTLWLVISYKGQYPHLAAWDLARRFSLTLGFLPDFNQHGWPFGSEIQVGGLFLFYAFQSVLFAHDNRSWDQRTLPQGIPRVLFSFLPMQRYKCRAVA